MENLLFDILNNPTIDSINKIESLLDKQEGIDMFISLLNKNNIIAFSYMKMQCKDWVINPIRQDFILKYKNTFYGLIESSSNQNLSLLCDFFEILFFNYFYWSDFINFLVVYKNPERSFKVLSCIFIKFRKLNKCDKLFSEIIFCIEQTKCLFEEYWFSGNKNAFFYDINLVSVFYSLVYQDIHIFYEENIDKFISTLCILFKKKELQSLICEIYNLFILKYPDLLDFTKVLGSVLISIDSFDFIKYTVILNIIKKRRNEVFIKFEDILINAIKLGSVLSEKEKEEMGSLEHSKNILNNIDIYRGILIDLIFNYNKNVNGIYNNSNNANMNISTNSFNNNISNMNSTNSFNNMNSTNSFNSSNINNSNISNMNSTNSFNSSNISNINTFLYKLLINPINEESNIFLYTTLKIRNDEIIKKCLITINNINSDQYLSFSSFRYLLVIKEYSFCDINFIDRNNISVYLCFEMLYKYIQHTSPLENQILDEINNTNINNLNKIITRTIHFLSGQEEDQYSLMLINRIVKYNIEYITDELYNFLIDFVNLNIRNINSPLAFQSIFDIFGILLTKKFNIKYEQDLVKIINIITTEEIIEMYNSGFYLLSIIILHSKNNYSNIISIISQDKIWKTKELLLSVICLTISLYKKGYMSNEQINYIIQYLTTGNKYYAFLLSDNTNYTLTDTEDIEEYFIVNSIQIKDVEGYFKIYKNAIEYFTENYITKKNARRICKSFLRGSKVLKDEMYKNIIEKNKFNLSYDNVPYSIYINFEI